MVWVAESELSSYETSTCFSYNELSIASSFVKARVGGARPVMTVSEICMESVSSRFALVYPLLWRRKGFEVIGWTLSNPQNNASLWGVLRPP